ncbi:hypothetical protein [Marivita geojedonensis]|nr:hypothetical protein [Marivita geojedonensis]
MIDQFKDETADDTRTASRIQNSPVPSQLRAIIQKREQSIFGGRRRQ